ncbi:ATPase mitochondria [Cordyceps militaris]|uniref:ATPase inhibitor, mitochondrial n=1 Tax=Cordyceps militaris TaxID=73501 RepID=A0A2H4S646_CORMI|nr:ATPase mitochondria [Cordyceps militaris]
MYRYLCLLSNHLNSIGPTLPLNHPSSHISLTDGASHAPIRPTHCVHHFVTADTGKYHSASPPFSHRSLANPCIANRASTPLPTMLRTTFAKTAALRPIRAAAFSTTARAMAEGDTGAPPRTGGQGDAFQRRERASEDYAIRQREKEKLLELKQRLAEQQEHLQRLSEHIDEITKDQGGEKN